MEKAKRNEVKVILVGDANVGKTSIAKRYIDGEFSKEIEPTVGAAYLTKDVELLGNKLTFNIWDTAGQETYRYLVPMYYRNSDIAIVVFDLTDVMSFASVAQWIDDIVQNLGENETIIICGNKSDCENRQVEFDTINEFITNTNSTYVEVSALTGANIDKLFETALMEYQKRNDIKKETRGKSLNLTVSSEKSGCC